MWFLLSCLVFADTGEPGTTHVVPVIPDPVAPGTRPARGRRPAPSFVRFLRVRVGAAEASPVVQSPPGAGAPVRGARPRRRWVKRAMACRTTVGVYLRQTCPGAGRERRGETAARRVLLTLMRYVAERRRETCSPAIRRRDRIRTAGRPRTGRPPHRTATAAAPADAPPPIFSNVRRVRQSVTFAHRYTLACARYNLFHAHTKWARQDRIGRWAVQF